MLGGKGFLGRDFLRQGRREFFCGGGEGGFFRGDLICVTF